MKELHPHIDEQALFDLQLILEMLEDGNLQEATLLLCHFLDHAHVAPVGTKKEETR